MNSDFQEITVSQLCDVITMLNPCMDDYLYVYDLVNDYYYISPHALKRFALPDVSFHQVIETHLKFVYPPDQDDLQTDLTAVMEGKKDFHNMQYRWISNSGEPIWINCRGFVVRKENKAMYMIGCINEIGAQQKADNISGLLGISSLQSYLSNGTLEKPKGYLMRLGLDDFKEINEKLGLDYGDMILRKTAECIEQCLLPGQRLYRAIADEFMILDFHGNDVEVAIDQYKNIRQTIDSFVEGNHYEAVFTISGGILNSDDCSHTYADMMKFSEYALNEAKRNGKNRSYVFSHSDYDTFLKRRRLTQLLRKAVNNNFEGFEAYLQPLFNASSNAIYGAEALMRFHSDEYGMVSPAEFIPLLEETGLIIPAGKWILHRSLEICRNIQKLRPDFQISVNVSYIQVMKSNIISEIISAVSQHGISPSTVIVELTESGQLSSDTRVTKLWSKLKEKKIRLALDDFGTGYSNFHYLNDLQPEIIKIDRSFTVKALENDYEYNLLSLMSDMAHSLDLKVCVEGIETSDELSRMKQLAPDYCQGYFFGRPCTYDEFVERYLA